jgi:hypothetical protein
MRKEEAVIVDLLHRAVPAKHTDEGLRALSGESPIRPESVQKYLESKFGYALENVSNAMLDLAKSLPPSQLAEKPTACARGMDRNLWLRATQRRPAGPAHAPVPHPGSEWGKLPITTGQEKIYR